MVACSRSFQKYGKICPAEGKPKKHKRVGNVLRQWCRESDSIEEAGAEQCTKRGPSFLLPPFHSLGHSFFSTSKPEATGSYAPSSWFAFTEGLFVATDDVPGMLHTLGARFPLLEKFRGFARASSLRRLLTFMHRHCENSIYEYKLKYRY